MALPKKKKCTSCGHEADTSSAAPQAIFVKGTHPAEGGPGSGPHLRHDGHAAAKYWHKKSMNDMGAKSPDEYIARTKAKGAPITPRDEKRIRKFVNESTFIPGVKPNKKESNQTLSVAPRKLKEAKSPTGRRYRCVMLEEGLGNLADAFYYSKGAISSAVKIFEGAKLMVNHPSKTEESDRPERDVKVIGGHWENCEYVRGENGRMQLQGDACVIDGEKYDWICDMLEAALGYADKYKAQGKQLIGFSINAMGDSEEYDAVDVLDAAPKEAKAKVQEAIELGNETIRVVTEITDCVSCDLVTEAGAGGRVLKLLEEEKMKRNKKNAKRTRENEQPAPDQKDGAGAPAGGEHGDEQQDKALISDMIQKHLGDQQVDEAAMNEMHGHYEAYAELGMEKEDAAKHAALEFKKGALLKQKSEAACDHDESEESHEAEEGVESTESEDSEEQEESAQEGEQPPFLKDKKKESNVKTKETDAAVVKMAARLTFLEGEFQKNKLAKYLDKKLAESKLPRQATDMFKKLFEGELKSEKQIDAKVEAYKAEVEEAQKGGYIVATEKAAAGGESDGGLDFSNCVTE